IAPGAVDAVLDCDKVLFFEEGAKSGGIGEAYGYDLLQRRFSGTYRYFAVDNTFVHHAKQASLRAEFDLDAAAMVRAVTEDTPHE
ncbi:MAG: hypothetical protein J6Y62_01405, partial [Clostridia bacterium]|nr:hypothetical protein [Clostridia bacterium]